MEEFEKALRSKNPSTQQHYRTHLETFSKWLDATPNEIVVFHKQKLASSNPSDAQQLRYAFEEFRDKYLIEELGLRKTTAIGYLNPINLLLSANSLGKLKQNWNERSYQGKIAITHDQIQEVLGYCGLDLRARALILVAKDTGLRRSDISQLLIEDFNGSQKFYDNQGREFRKWKTQMITKKNGALANIHLGYESIEAIKNYLGNRTTGHIFLVMKNNNRHYKYSRIGEPMTADNVGKAINKKLEPLRKRGINVTSHSLRKFFLTQMTGNGMILEMTKMLCGKTVPYNDLTYLQWGDQITDKYMEVYDKALAINRTTIEMKKFEHRIAELEWELNDRRGENEYVQFGNPHSKKFCKTVGL